MPADPWGGIPVPEGYTIVVKTHFEIQVRKNGVVEIAVKSKAGAVTKTAKATFTVERKNNFSPLLLKISTSSLSVGKNTEY
jgi:hypothetical protein